MAQLKTDDPSATLRRSEFVGPQVGDELAVDGLLALGFVVVGIMIYLALRFEWTFAVAAIVANPSDTGRMLLEVDLDAAPPAEGAAP